MNIKFGYPKFMPSPYSIYVSDFNDRLASLFKGSRFARYHSDTREYEITPELYDSVKNLEYCEELNSLPDNKLYKVYSYTEDYPYKYQDDAVDFMRHTDSALINFSQGMGKTLTTLKILESRDCHKILIITGVSNLQEEWMKDATKHASSTGQCYKDRFNMSIVAGNPDASVANRIKYLKEAHTAAGNPIFADLISIESLRGVPIVEAINAIKYDAIVIDECQSAKGMNAEQSQGVHEIEYHEGQIRLALSGTPALNDPLEYYSVLRFLRVLYYKSRVSQCSRTLFNNYYGTWQQDFWGHLTCTEYRNLDQLKLLLEPVLIYAPKDLLKLPKKRRHLIELELANQEYDSLLALYRKGTKAVKRAGYKTIHELAAKLQFMTSTDVSKKKYIMDNISSRPLVFSQYTRVLDDVKSYLEDRGAKVLYYHGKLKMKERLEVLERWKSGEGNVLLLSLSCSRYGLNLQETQTSIFLEPPTSPAILEQAEDRLHRIGQQKEVNSYVLLCGDSDISDWDRLVKKMEVLKL